MEANGCGVQEVISVVGAQLLQLLDGVKGGGVMEGHSWLAEAGDEVGVGDESTAVADSDVSTSLMTSLTAGSQHVTPGGAVGGFRKEPAPSADTSSDSRPPPSAGRYHAARESPGGSGGAATPASAGRYHAMLESRGGDADSSAAGSSHVLRSAAPPPSAGRYHAAADAAAAAGMQTGSSRSPLDELASSGRSASQASQQLTTGAETQVEAIASSGTARLSVSGASGGSLPQSNTKPSANDGPEPADP